MINNKTTLSQDAREKADSLKEKATDSIAAGLAQLKHIRGHLKDGLGAGAQQVLDKHITATTEIVEDLALLDLGLAAEPKA